MLRPLTQGHSFVIPVIAHGFYLTVAPLQQKLTHRLTLVPAVLQQQPATRRQMGRRLRHYQADIRQPLLVGHQGGARLEAHISLLEVRIRPVDIGRVGDDHGKARRVRERFKPAAVAHLDGQPQGRAVGAGQRRRLRHPVNGPQVEIRAL
ncbi:hypothetical protein D3C79_724800 [compost metagenome]